MDEAEKLQRQVLLLDNLVAIVDPTDGLVKQVSVDAAKRWARVNTDVAKILDGLGISYTEVAP